MSRWRRDTSMQVFIQSHWIATIQLIRTRTRTSIRIRINSASVCRHLANKTIKDIKRCGCHSFGWTSTPPTVATSDQICWKYKKKTKQNKTETENRNAKLHKNNNNKMRKRVKRKTKRRLDADAANEIRKELPNASVASIDRFVSPSFLFHHLFDWLARSARACSFAWLCSAPLYSALRLHNQQRAALNGATNHIKSMSLRKFWKHRYLRLC